MAEKTKSKKQSLASSHYEISGAAIKPKNKTCPRCGPGYFLAEHNNRLTCGKCGYTEFKKN
ncbi:MAG: 30S ribosomal protein S27ae [Candidatus Woesearchaeota archaeon]